MDESRVFNPLDLQLSRSVYNVCCHSMGTCMPGRLIPAKVFNVLPGEELKLNVKSLFKMSTPVYPTMDYLYVDIAFFFVPYKLILSRRYASPTTNDASQSWEGFIGAQDFAVNMPIPAAGVTLPVPSFGTYDTNNEGKGSLGEYLYGPDAGYSQGVGCNALPALAYYAIWNENYREPNVQPSVTWNYGVDANGRTVVAPQSTPLICLAPSEASFRTLTAGTYQDAIPANTAARPGLYNTCPLPTSIFHGYFGSLLPWPQRNLTGIQLPVGQGFVPLTTDMATASHGFGNFAPNFGSNSTFLSNLDSGDTGGSLVLPIGYNNSIRFANVDTTHNLGIDLSSATGVDIEAFRALITKQHWYEDLARSGNRLDELEYGTFGVRPKDSGLDRPMYLGGKRIQLNVDMVASTNGGTTSGSAAGAGSLGDLGAFSHTNDEDFYFHNGFDTWGCVMCVFTIRSHNLIASGVDRHWMKATREDWYWPEFARLGNQPIFKYEVRAGITSPAVLGYQEYAEEWREDRDIITGLLVPGRSLGFMTYAHRYTAGASGTDPDLGTVLDASKQWMDVDRTLAVQASASGFQFIYQMTFEGLRRSPVGRDVAPGVSRI